MGISVSNRWGYALAKFVIFLGDFNSNPKNGDMMIAIWWVPNQNMRKLRIMGS